MAEYFEVYIDAGAKPTIEGYNNLTKGILPKGIYSGGEVTQGIGRTINVAEFIAKSQDGFTVKGTSQNINLVSPYVGDWALVLYTKSWSPGDSVKAHSVEFRIVPWTTSGSTPGYSDVTSPDPDRNNYILFSRFKSKNINDSVRILPEDIDSSFGDRISVSPPMTQTLSGTENFNGPAGVLVYHNLGHLNYRVQLTPSQQANTGLGDIWIEKSPTFFTAKCSGEATTTFDWSMFVTLNKFGLQPQQVYGSRFGNTITKLSNPANISHEEDSHNYLSFAAPIGDTPSSFIACSNEFYKTLVATTTVDAVPTAWQIISANVKRDITINTVVETLSGQAVIAYPVKLSAATVKAFAYPLVPVDGLANPTVEIGNAPDGSIVIVVTAKIWDGTTLSSAPDGTAFALAFFQNPYAYMSGSVVSALNSYTVKHNLDFPYYLPLIAITNVLSGPVTGYSLEIKPNHFTIHLPIGTQANFNWLIVPSFTA